LTRSIGLVFGLAVVLFTGQASAQPGWYGGGMGGLSVLHDSDNNFSGGGSTTTEYDVGAGFGIMGGWDFGNNIRAELELSYRMNDADRQISPTIGLHGTTSALALMANGFYDFHFNQWTPFVGAGIGFARVASDINSGGTQLVDDSDVVFAYQFIGGVGYKITPRFLLSLDYRIFGTTDPELTATGGTKFDAEYFTQHLMLGARYKF
jgi:OOP family OmpA-OmpF porin